ncbi:MAG: thioredoxin peroxidase [Bdellovibrio sp. CG12_big_fil_rev_8_21_14_0_65_39_13]|nr:MAG: thioredoxin peroxidase [Bdellovibrio sp. CG22_combo_CG10-13_8_21_14_all_39_27]PIQ57899.1 MAG: thioredoxin peroxidase [Bdellovibrio sp. CG12_big_fil_rev_8_21_14_0_65_39_13]PIR34569.1 MAG: thioredoxin peroxidase [Bdellovibrio sp. CG11_big_fil_rev_8_21_14_0_20_39_38]
MRLVGNKAPAFKATALVNGDFKEMSLDNFKGKWKVLFFYPLDFTFVCPTEIVAFSEAAEKFRSIGCELIGCSVDSQFSHLAWTQQPRNKGGLGEMKIPLLADITKQIANDYGVLVDNSVALRGTFIIDNNDIIQQATINNLSVGRNVDEILRLVEAYQYTATHGEVCPAGWTKGDKTMKPDPKGSQEYFNTIK